MLSPGTSWFHRVDKGGSVSSFCSVKFSLRERFPPAELRSWSLGPGTKTNPAGSQVDHIRPVSRLQGTFNGPIMTGL